MVELSSRELSDFTGQYQDKYGQSLANIAIEMFRNLNYWLKQNPINTLKLDDCVEKIENIIAELKGCYEEHLDVAGIIYYAPNNLDAAINRFRLKNHKPVEYDTLWLHCNIRSLTLTGRINKNDYPELSVSVLERVAKCYVNNEPWVKSSTLDWLLVDALLFAETVAFARAVPDLQPNYTGLKWLAWKSVWKVVREGLVLFLTAIVSNIADHSTGTTFWIVFATITLIRWLNPNNVIKAKLEMKPNLLLIDMISFYEARLNTAEFNPRLVREMLYDLEKKGAVYSPCVFDVLDRMISRPISLSDTSNH